MLSTKDDLKDIGSDSEEVSSRRATLLRIGGGGLAAVLASSWWMREASAQASRQIPPLLVEWAAAFSSGDVDRVMRVFTSDATLEDVALGFKAQGATNLRGLIQGYFAAVPDFRVTLVSGFRSGEYAAAEWVQSGTPVADLPDIPVSGKSFSSRGVSTFELRGDKIRVETEFYDYYTLIKQLRGTSTAPAATRGSQP